MVKVTTSLSVAGALLAIGASAVPAAAQTNRTFVSGKGSDTGACTVAAPCRSFAFAQGQTAAGGEIDVLDSAGYGAVTISKAIGIVNDGVGTAGITAGSSNGITINAGANDSVHLRGLTIEGLGTGSNGIQFNTGQNLAIENCVIRGFTGDGIFFGPTGFAAASDNATGVFSHVITSNNGNGIVVSGVATTGSASVTIVDSVASNNNGAGISAGGESGRSFPTVMVRNSVVSYNGTGLSVTKGTVRVAQSVITGNGNAVSTFGPTVFSYGDNDINGNGNDNLGSLTKIPTH